MIELGELEAHHAEFEKRGVRVIVISNDDQEDSKKTQTQFPHLVVVADKERKMIDALEVLHPGAKGGDDAAAPTTFLVDGKGTVAWMFRPDRVIVRLSPGQLLAAVDEHLR